MKIFIKGGDFHSEHPSWRLVRQHRTILGGDRQKRSSIRLGAEIKKDNLKKNRTRALSEHLIIPKGEWQLGRRFRTSAYRAATANI